MSPPLRQLYIDGKDDEIEDIINKAIDSYFKFVLAKQPEGSFVRKTVGLQAFFSFFKTYLRVYSDRDFLNFDNTVKEIGSIDFSDDFYTSSGMG